MGASDSFRRLEEELDVCVCLMRTWGAGEHLGSLAQHAHSRLRQYSLGSSGGSSKATDLNEARMSQQPLGLLPR